MASPLQACSNFISLVKWMCHVTRLRVFAGKTMPRDSQLRISHTLRHRLFPEKYLHIARHTLRKALGITYDTGIPDQRSLECTLLGRDKCHQHDTSCRESSGIDTCSQLRTILLGSMMAELQIRFKEYLFHKLRHHNQRSG